MPGYRSAIVAANSSTTPSPHSADAIFLLMYLPSSQYRSTSSVLIAWYARRRAASISARTSSNLRPGASVVVRRDGATAGCFAAFAGILRDIVTELAGSRSGRRRDGGGRASRVEEALTVYANAPLADVAELRVAPVPIASLR